jgi:hypothetical protein
MARLQEVAPAPLAPAGGRDLREMVVRYGWSTAYSRDRRIERDGTPIVSGHEPRPSYYLFPADEALAAPGSARPESWTLDPPLAPARYAPGVRLAPLAAQTAWFRRGDSTLVAAALRVPHDTLLAGAAATLALARDERTPAVRAAATADRGARLVLTAAAPWRPALVGVELIAGDGAAARRLRHGLPPADGAGLALSSLLLLDAADSLPSSLAEALPLMRTGVRARRGDRLGLFWEVYGLRPDAPAVTVSLGTARAGGAPLARRAAEALRLRRAPAPVAVRWSARAEPTGGVAAAAIVLRLADLEPGRYRVTVAVRDAEGRGAAAEREIVVER